MQLKVLTFLVAGAGIAFQDVVAAPPRVIVVTNTNMNAVRFGHAVPSTSTPPTFDGARSHCGGGTSSKGRYMIRFRKQALEISNAFREALGMELIRIEHHTTGMRSSSESISIIRGGWTKDKEAAYDMNKMVYVPSLRPYRPSIQQIETGQRMTFQSSWDHLQEALAALGPWEGRAVAFVFGCGIGVLLRMFWVIGMIAYEGCKGSDDADEEHLDAEEVFVAPPEYTYKDEKKGTVEVNAPPESV